MRFLRALWLPPAIVAGAAWLAIVVALDPAGDHPGGWDGPGLTLDEPFNVPQGCLLIDKLFDFDLAGLRQVDNRLPDHPPLGRLWIGLCHELAFLVWPPVDREVPYSIACARVAPATAFALTVFLVGWCAGRWYGRFAGVVAALALVFMPRLFGHAHLASLESEIDLAYAAVVLFLADRWCAAAGENSPAPGPSSTFPWVPLTLLPTRRTAAIGGVLFGLALATKIQAVLLPIPVALWALICWRHRAVLPLIVWGVVAILTFYVVWPYLHRAPFAHLFDYLGRAGQRSVTNVWYFGGVVADRDVPWHYPWLIFLATVPVGLHLLGVVGVVGGQRAAWRSPRELLVLACIAFPLVVFSIPRVAVYDGERLFSVVFPLWALFVGRGAQLVKSWLARRLSKKPAVAATMLFVALQSYGLFATAPCWLSYYNVLVGGLRGAERIGLQTTYWGDSLTRSFLKEVAGQVPAGSNIRVLPVLYIGQWDELRQQSPVLRESEIRFVVDAPDRPDEADFVLMFLRKEYLPAEFRGPLDPHRILAEVRRSGVPLAVLYRR